MKDYDSAIAIVNHMYTHDIWNERFMMYKKKKVIEEPLVDRISMSNFRAKDDKQPKIQVNMKDLKKGVPYKNGYLKAEIVDKCIAFQYDGVSFCAKLMCKD